MGVPILPHPQRTRRGVINKKIKKYAMWSLFFSMHILCAARRQLKAIFSRSTKITNRQRKMMFMIFRQSNKHFTKPEGSLKTAKLKK